MSGGGRLRFFGSVRRATALGLLLLATTPPSPALAAESRSARAAVGFWEGVPAPTVLLLPVAISLFVLLGLVLGPLGRPAPVFARQGGLSRALARRSPSGSDAGAPPPRRPTLTDFPGRAQ